jgi:hypothetical protein
MRAEIGDDKRIAVERIQRIARIAQRLKAHRARIHHQHEANTERDEVLKRMLKMPPKPHKSGVLRKAKTPKRRAKKG